MEVIAGMTNGKGVVLAARGVDVADVVSSWERQGSGDFQRAVVIKAAMKVLALSEAVLGRDPPERAEVALMQEVRRAFAKIAAGGKK
jgi:hypothetical protein